MNSVPEAVFWVSVFFVSYTYAGYAVLLWIAAGIKELFTGKAKPPAVTDFPEVTLLIAAYNERECVDGKVANSRALDYPKDKLKQVWMCDGSDDGTPELLQQYADVTVYHCTVRAGKIAAVNRGMRLVSSPIVVFSDANTMLGRESILRMVALFVADPGVGCVSGEKRISSSVRDIAAGAGEGLYWKYESFLKRCDSRLYSVTGAAGELFAIRRELFTEVEEDTLLDDFMISLRIAMQGYTTQYDPEAYACETSSVSVREELKRKIRIAAGGFQSIVRLAPLLNIFRYGILSFQYISHRVLRWTLAPLCLLLLLTNNLVLALQTGIFSFRFFPVMFWMQVLFYAAALTGFFLENRRIRFRIVFVPYYFFIMNLAVYMGFFRYLTKRQGVNWEKVKRR